MPKDWDPHYEDEEQEWEPVILKKTQNKDYNLIQTNSPIFIHHKIRHARSNSNMTTHQLAQALHMKIRDYNMIETGEIKPTKALISKLHKFINLQI